MRNAILIFFLFVVSYSYSQNFDHWNENVGWDGVTHYTSYYIMSPEYFGPNALPVPELKKGILSNASYFENSLNRHFGKGDQTNNLFTRIYSNFGHNRIGVELFWVPVEYYQLDIETRDNRYCRSIDPKGFAVGDIYFGTTIQLIRDHNKYPDITLSLYGRTTSGTHLQDARFTDTPGYYFDFSFGKNINTTALFDSARWYGSIGFYNWQTNLRQYFQNDAGIIGVGTQLNRRKWQIDLQLTGYIGYIGAKDYIVVNTSKNQYTYEGDVPFVCRLKLMYRLNSLSVNLSYQAGLNDFPYHSVSLGLINYFNPFPK